MLNSDHIVQVIDLLSLAPSSFICIHDPVCSNITTAAFDSSLSERSQESVPRIHHILVDGVACFTSRILFDTIINGLSGRNLDWNEGCSNWSAENRQERYNESLDGFIHGIRAVYSHLVHANGDGPVRLVVAVVKPERLKERVPEVIVPLSRLGEMSRVDISVVFISEARWEDIRPPLGAALDPFFVDIPVPSKDAAIEYLCEQFKSSYGDSSDPDPTNAYTSFLEPIYEHFISILYDTCDPYTKDPQEIQYISAARWPGFIKPVLLDFQQAQADATQNGQPPPDFDIPVEARLRLFRAFKPSLRAAMEDLYPRTTNAVDWSKANEPDEDFVRKMFEAPGSLSPTRRGRDELEFAWTSSDSKGRQEGIESLSRQSKYILLASFIASSNPAKTDLRMFGRGVDEKKRKRRVMKARATTRTNTGPVKIPQPFVGPSPFPLDRMLAILGALLEDNDVDTRIRTTQYSIAGEHTDMEISRVETLAAIVELTTLRLLHRTSPHDKIDGPPMFRCSISHQVAQSLAKQLGVQLHELLWDPL